MNLVIVNLWNRPTACEALFQGEGYDLAVLNPTDDPFVGPCRYQLHRKGFKWKNLAALVEKHPEIKEDYDYFWVIDDDVRAGPAEANRLFEMMAKHGLDVAQPSLTPDSYRSHEITVHDARFERRLTSLVEIMAPCFGREAFRICLPTFDVTYSGWGLDWVWPKLMLDRRGYPTCGVVDAVQVTHTCPVSSRDWTFPNGKSAEDEMRELLIEYRVAPRSFMYELRAARATVDDLYDLAVRSSSDINEHLPTLRMLAAMVSHVTEFGTRSGLSTAAFLKAAPERVVSYDLVRRREVAGLEIAAKRAGISFEHLRKDVLATEIEPTDLLFIDSIHTYDRICRELELHGDKARVFIAFHGTTAFAEVGEVSDSRGIWPAIEAYFATRPGWRLLGRWTNNNGLAVFMNECARVFLLSPAPSASGRESTEP